MLPRSVVALRGEIVSLCRDLKHYTVLHSYSDPQTMTLRVDNGWLTSPLVTTIYLPSGDAKPYARMPWSEFEQLVPLDIEIDDAVEFMADLEAQTHRVLRAVISRTMPKPMIVESLDSLLP